MRTVEVRLRTGRRVVTDVTENVASFAADLRTDGLLHVFLPHATAGLALMETGAGSEQDLEDLVVRLFPREDRYAHRHGSTGHGGDHVMPALVSPSLVLSVERGHVVLGTWQRVVVVDPNPDNPERVLRLSFLEG